MVNDKFKPNDSDFRTEEEAMLREMLDAGFLEMPDDLIRVGPPHASRLFLKDAEVTTDTRPYRYPDDVNENPQAVKQKYSEFKK